MRGTSALAVVLAVAAATLAQPQLAHAQPAFAIGHPLAAPDFDVGEISVRVIAGTISKPVIGADVTLIVGGTPRVARTDEGGRAFFKEIPPGTPVQASIKDADGKDVLSDTFPVPDSGGMHVMLSTVPVDPNAMPAGGAPFAGGAMAGGMPEPRKISGFPRPEQKNPAGTVSVRVVYDSLSDKVPNIPVSLVAYGWDGKVGVETKQTDAEGRAMFTGLDVSGGVAYYAMAQVPRNGKLDRLVSAPIVPQAQVGVALALSSEKQDSTEPVIDDQNRLDKQSPDLAPGKVEVSLDGDIVAANPVDLVDVIDHRIVGHVTIDRFPPDPQAITASANFQARADEPPGTLDLTIHGGMGSTDKPLPGVAIVLYTTDDDKLANPFPGTTNDSGIAHFALKAGMYHAVITVNGKELNSAAIDLTTGGAALAVGAKWEAVGRPRALFSEIPVVPGQTLCAELVSRTGTTVRSAPFQLVADHGTSASIRAVPIFFTFHIVTGVEDSQFAVQGQFSLMNFAWAPYKAGPDGLDIPLPRGYKGAIVADRDQQTAGVEAGVGFRVPRPLVPAGQTTFKGAFSLPVDDGTVHWAQDLPLGSVESWIRMVQLPTMSVEVPAGTRGSVVDTEEGPIYQIPQITIQEGHSMVLAIHGLPQPPMWKVWLPRIVGLLVIALILAGVTIAVTRGGGTRGRADPAREARRSKLLEELVELERSGKDAKRRESLLTELEKLWDDSAA